MSCDCSLHFSTKFHPFDLSYKQTYETRGEFLDSKKSKVMIATDPIPALKHFFGYDAFRTYNGEALQENAVRAALAGESVLTIFPTGGGKSITFQLPALMEWTASKAMTVVVSPLQSLMKDQVDNLLKHHITEAATINGLLTPVERACTMKRIEEGSVAIVYVSPEQLRSGSFMRLLMKRKIARFVIDEAHCFSSWGHDFRVDYLYIGEFLSELKRLKGLPQAIPVSCFTATAKQQVMTEIMDYFKSQNGLNLKLFKTVTDRTNLHYHVLECRDETEKYTTLRQLICQYACPTIIYVSRTARAVELAHKLCQDKISACPFHGQMIARDKIDNQNAFLNNEISVMVATSAFGMGVDKKDIGLVIHHDISSSLEAYMQESGRAGRDQSIVANCYLLYTENDLDENFSLNQHAQISITDVNAVWKVVKQKTSSQDNLACSAYEIAKWAGLRSTGRERVQDLETRALVCLSALEQAGYLHRQRNAPIPLASSLHVTDQTIAENQIQAANHFSEDERALCVEIMRRLIEAHKKKQTGEATDEELAALTQIDQLASKLITTKRRILNGINLLREINLLSDDLDLLATVRAHVEVGHLKADLIRFHTLESLIISRLKSGTSSYSLKEINDSAIRTDCAESGIHTIRTLLDFHAIRHDWHRQDCSNSDLVRLELLRAKEVIADQMAYRYSLCDLILSEIINSANAHVPSESEIKIPFSLVQLLQACRRILGSHVSQSDIEEALLFMRQIEVIGLDGGFLVRYNRIRINRLNKKARSVYTDEDFTPFKNFYRAKNESVHIIGEYARLMKGNAEIARRYVQDYFQLDQEDFVEKHFKGLHAREMRRAMTQKRYQEIFGQISDSQQAMIDDHESRVVAVLGGPGCGKTHFLVKKMAALLLLDEIPGTQLMLLTFTHAAASEFKRRLIDLVGPIAHRVDVKTFHSYAMDILGRLHMPQMRKGNAGPTYGYESYISEQGAVATAAESVMNGTCDCLRTAKSVVLIDEAQDMGKDEYALVKSLMSVNPMMRIVAVGDDDQIICQFRGGSGRAFRRLIDLKGARLYELCENYRSASAIVRFTNAFAETITNRIKRQSLHSDSNLSGRVEIIEYADENIEVRMIDSFIRNQLHMNGTCAVLTQTNSEAVILSGLLLHRGIRAKLIQTDDDFSLFDLAEMRYFIRHLKSDGEDGPVSEERWGNAIKKLRQTYARSACLEYCLKVIETFRTEQESEFFCREFEAYLNESKFDEFREIQENTVIVSTLHKAKGCQFDSVCLCLKNFEMNTDEVRRLLYVAMTRARQNLIIHSHGSRFEELKHFATSFDSNSELNLPKPKVVSFMLTHHDMNLGYFENYKNIILRLQSGDPLTVKGSNIYAHVSNKCVQVGQFSRSFSERVQKLECAGYHPSHASVSVVLAWYSQKNDKEIAILLPLITFENRHIDRKEDNVSDPSLNFHRRVCG